MNDEINNCVFCKVAKGGAITPIRYEDEDLIAVDDLHPDAPIHVVVITKRHIQSLAQFEQSDQALAGKILLVCKQIAKEMNIEGSGYRVVINVGKWGGQVIPHWHCHILGGAPLPTRMGLSVGAEVEVATPLNREVINGSTS